MDSHSKDKVTIFILHEIDALSQEERLPQDKVNELHAEILSSDEMLYAYINSHQLMEDFVLNLQKEIYETRLAWHEKGVGRYGFAWPINLVRDLHKGQLNLDMLPYIVKTFPLEKKKEFLKKLDAYEPEPYTYPNNDNHVSEASLILPATPTDMEIKLNVGLVAKNLRAGLYLNFASQPVEITLFENNGSSSVALVNVNGPKLENILLPFNKHYSVKIAEHGIAEYHMLLRLEEFSGKKI